MKKCILAILVAVVGVWTAWAYPIGLKYDAVPAHVTLTFSGRYQSDVSVSVAGPAEGATLNQFTDSIRGWTIEATPDVGYETPTFSTCFYDDTNGDLSGTAQDHVGSATRTNYNVHVYNIAVSPKQVTVYFVRVRGSFPYGTPNSRVVPYDSAYGALPVPSCEGWDFVGWFTESEGGTQVTESDLMKVNASTQTLYAHWTPITYTVAFNANGGSGAMVPMTLAYDQREKLTQNAFTRANYTFDRWRSSDGQYYGNGVYVEALTNVAGAVVTLYAQWTPDAHTITFDSDGGTAVLWITNDFGAAVSPPLDPTREGYTFAGWSPALPATMPPTNLTVTAIWKANEYELVFDAVGGAFDAAGSSAVTNLLLYGATVEVPADPARDGYAFGGWSPEPPATITNHLTVTAQWVPQNSVTVTFTVQDGGITTNGLIEASEAPSNVMVSDGGHKLSADYMCGSRFGWLPQATNVNKKVQGWRFKQDGVWQAVTSNTIVQASNMTNLVVQWERDDLLADALDVTNLTVTASDGWERLDDGSVTGGSCLRISAFTGVWADVRVSVTGGGTLTYDWKIVSDEASTLPWTWGNGIKEYMQFYTNYTDSMSFVYGIAATQDSLFETNFVEKTGSLGAWSPEWRTRSITFGDEGVTNTVRWFFRNKGGTAWLDNIRWTGEGTREPLPTHTVTFDANGGEGQMADLSVNENGKPLAANAFSRAGYVFAGWNTQPDGSGLAITNGALLAAAKGVTLYAQWQEDTFTISFDLDGGTGIPPSITQAFGTAIVLPVTAPSREGQVFAGWDPALPETMPSSNLTVTAQWTPELHTIVFETAGGSEVPAITQGYGTPITAQDPTREGHTFAGWVPALPATITNDLTVTAQWTVNQYTITFDTAGGSAVAPITQDFGTAVTPPADPVREGYVFAGWTPALPATMPAGDLTVTAQWTANQYTITFDTAGGSAVAPIVQSYGMAVTPPVDPVRAGYAFGGWTPALPATMPASNLTVVALWTLAEDPTNPPLEGKLYASVASELVESAVAYDGCLYDAQGRVAGIVQVKRGKYSAQKGLAKVTAAVTLAGKKKQSFSGGEWHSGSDYVTLRSAKDGRALKVVLGARGLAGTYGDEYAVDGAANLFTSKDAAAKADGAAVLGGLKAVGGGTYALAVPSDAGWGGLTIAVKARGKVSVTGTLADGKKMNVSSQLLIGEAWCCIPVVSPKFAEPAFVVWLVRNGGAAEVVGLDGAKLAAVRSGLAAGSAFTVDEAALVAVLGSALRTDYLPNGFPVTAAGTKWLVAGGAKAGQVKVDNQTGALTTTSENWASLKLTYKAKTGQFAGSFKAYLLADGKLKSTAVKVAGVLVDGTGYGSATVKKQSATVTVAPENN